MGPAMPSVPGQALSLSAPAAARLVLSPRGEEILRAIAPAVLGPLLPADLAARAQALEMGVASVDDYLAHLSLPLQREARFLFAALAFWPTRLLLLGTWRRWSAVPPARIQSFLLRARDSRVLLMRRAFAFLHALAVLAWFDLPEAWTEIGYPGPPVERPVRPGAA